MISAKDIYESEQEFRLSEGQRQYLDFLLEGTGFEPEKHDALKQQLEALGDDEMEYIKMLFKLRNAQLDRISFGLNYNMHDIIDHLRKLL